MNYGRSHTSRALHQSQTLGIDLRYPLLSLSPVTSVVTHVFGNLFPPIYIYSVQSYSPSHATMSCHNHSASVRRRVSKTLFRVLKFEGNP